MYDFETDHTDPHTCNPVQLAAIMVNPRTLKVIEGSEFNTKMQPIGIGEDNYVEDHKDTIDWHANIQKTTSEKIVEGWKKSPQQKDAFLAFKEYLLRYHTRTQRKSKWSAPIRAGHNIVRFDNIIMKRLCESYNCLDKGSDMTLFYPRDQIDSMFYCYAWWENCEEPSSYSWDYLRPYLGMSTKGAHDALQDVRDTAKLICGFLRLNRKFADITNFKDAFGTKQ